VRSTGSAAGPRGHRSDRGAVATPHWLATAAAMDALDAGGTALDAALSAASTLVVVYPHACSLGGDLIAMVIDPSGQINVINSTGATNARGNMPLPLGSSMPERGPIPITVPGVVAGVAA
jgi:oxamate amidohydrolase